jgi:hypothetical protein
VLPGGYKGICGIDGEMYRLCYPFSERMPLY